MTTKSKKVEELSASDLEKYPVWRFTNADEVAGETIVSPVTRIPVKNMTGKIVGTQVHLRNGSKVWAILGNLDLENEKLTKHFLTLSVLRDRAWFTMARYHDFDSEKRGPLALNDFLGLTIEEVFPVSYDISDYCTGSPRVLVGVIEKEPIERLSRAEIIALAVP